MFSLPPSTSPVPSEVISHILTFLPSSLRERKATLYSLLFVSQLVYAEAQYQLYQSIELDLADDSWCMLFEGLIDVEPGSWWRKVMMNPLSRNQGPKVDHDPQPQSHNVVQWHWNPRTISVTAPSHSDRLYRRLSCLSQTRTLRIVDHQVRPIMSQAAFKDPPVVLPVEAIFHRLITISTNQTLFPNLARVDITTSKKSDTHGYSNLPMSRLMDLLAPSPWLKAIVMHNSSADALTPALPHAFKVTTVVLVGSWMEDGLDERRKILRVGGLEEAEEIVGLLDPDGIEGGSADHDDAGREKESPVLMLFEDKERIAI